MYIAATKPKADYSRHSLHSIGCNFSGATGVMVFIDTALFCCLALVNIRVKFGFLFVLETDRWSYRGLRVFYKYTDSE